MDAAVDLPRQVLDLLLLAEVALGDPRVLLAVGAGVAGVTAELPAQRVDVVDGLVPIVSAFGAVVGGGGAVVGGGGAVAPVVVTGVGIPAGGHGVKRSFIIIVFGTAGGA